MILQGLDIVLAIFCLIFGILSCFSRQKFKVFLYSTLSSILVSLLLLRLGGLTYITLIVLPFFLLTDALFYSFSISLPHVHSTPSQSTISRFHIIFSLWSCFIGAFLLIYKFILSVYSKSNEGNAEHFVTLEHIGGLLWNNFFFITLLIGIIALIVLVGSTLLVRIGE